MLVSSLFFSYGVAHKRPLPNYIVNRMRIMGVNYSTLN